MGAWPGAVTKGSAFSLGRAPTPAGCWHHERWEPWQGVAEPPELPSHGWGGPSCPLSLSQSPSTHHPPRVPLQPPPFCLPCTRQADPDPVPEHSRLARGDWGYVRSRGDPFPPPSLSSEDISNCSPICSTEFTYSLSLFIIPPWQ